MQRGEIWWAKLPPPAGRRPVVLVSRDEAYLIRDWVMVAPVTTRIRDMRSEVKVGPQDGLLRPSVVNCDSLVTIPKARLSHHIALLRAIKIQALNDALNFALGLP
ncbi:MAG TPA: type II toxin-antitoxin system PemK/MazF family toxin [Candidatus Fraserbacteria bacterium]|nr:type II toxin-antitoxin system PemK/MazF family toxin [Candidatus Fraserbacteria bacterium]